MTENELEVTCRKITDLDLMKECLEFAYGITNSKADLATSYFREHSPIRTQMFIIKMKNVLTKVSVHLVRHAAVGQFHLVGSNRADWNDKDDLHTEEWDTEVNRLTPVNHVMILNAQHLIDMARKRLCGSAEADTQNTMKWIREAVLWADPDLAALMQPNCFYRGGICPEAKCCGQNRDIMEHMIAEVPESFYRKVRNDKMIAEQGLIIQ